ncbi:MAG: aminotransferase class V-fold PLP-dependent enzyme [Gemmatimonadota bacterium]
MPTTIARSDFARAREIEYRWSGPGAYLNAASWGPISERARAAAASFAVKRQRAELGDADFAAILSRARTGAARLIGADPSEIALTQNTTTGINLAAHFAAQRGREGRKTIVLCDREFPANVYPWLALRRQGFEVRIIPTRTDGNPDESALMEAVQQPDVVAFAYSFVQFATGYRANLIEFGRICAEREILFSVDAIQGLGAVPVDVKEARIDVLASGAQKWLCSPWGVGFAYVRGELCPEFEPYLPGWLAFQASRDFTRLVDYDYDLVDNAERFEVGTQSFESCVAFAESLDLLLELGVDRIYDHVLGLQDRIIAWAAARSQVEIVSDRSARSGILCLRPPAAALAHRALLDAGVTCALREGSIRISPHFYNDAEDIDRVIGVLDGALPQ